MIAGEISGERPKQVVNRVAAEMMQSPIQHSVAAGIEEAGSHIKDVISEIKDEAHNKINKAEHFLEKYVPVFLVNGVKGMLEYALFEKFKATMIYLSKHPLFALPLFVFISFIVIPASIFSFLALVTTAVTFFGFLLIEGTLIGIGAVITGGIVLTIFGFAFLIVLGVSVFAFTLQKIGILKSGSSQ